MTRWEYDEDDLALIERLEASDKEIDNAYAEAYRAGCWIKEWEGITGVGDRNVLVEIEKKLGKEIVVSELTAGDVVYLAFPGFGDTRVERIRDGVRQVIESRGPVTQLEE